MAITIDGTAGTIAGLVAGGLPDGIVDADMLATSAVTSVKILDGTIANSDINASAAIAASKLSGAGKVLQVVSDTDTSSYTTSTTSATQGPQTSTLNLNNSSNKVLIIVTFVSRMYDSSGISTGGRYALYRGSIATGTKLTLGTEPQTYYQSAGWEQYNITTITYYDTPAANTTYSLGFWKHTNGDSCQIKGDMFTTHFTLMEIGA